MTRRAIALLAACMLATMALASHVAAQSSRGVPNPMQGFSQNRNEPMHIQATRLEVRDKEKIATFTGNVQVVQGDTTLKCKVLVVYYDNADTPGAIKTTAAGPGGRQQIRRLEARGGVVVTQKDQVATGDVGTFDVRTNTVTLSGNVVVNQGPNVTRGDRLVVNLTTGVSHIEAGKSNGPVQMLIQNTPSKTNAVPPIGPQRLMPGRP